MSDAEQQKALYTQLRETTAQMLGLDLAKLSPTDNLKLDLTSLLRLQLDHLHGIALAGREVDTAKLSACVTMLHKLLPPAATEASTAPDFSDALPTLQRIVEQRRSAIEARETHLSEIYAKEIVELKATISKLHDDLATARFLDLQTASPEPEPQTSNQPPLPAPAAHPPAAYLQRGDEPWRPYVVDGGINAPGPIPGSSQSRRTW